MSNLEGVIADYNAFFSLAVMLTVTIIVIGFTWVGRVWRRIPPVDTWSMRWIALGLFCLSVAVRLIRIDYSFWYDEFFTALTSTLPIDRFLQVVAGDVHPPLFYLLERVTVAVLGRSELVFRFWSVVAGGISVVLVLRIAFNDLKNQNQATAAALIACFLPGLITFAQDARSYSLLAALLLTCYLAVSTRHFGLYLLVGSLALWLHYFAAFYILALFVGFGLVFNREDRLFLIASTVGIGLAFTPLLPMAINQTRVVSGGFWISDLTVGRAIAEPFLMLVTSALAPGAFALTGIVIGLLLTGAGIVERVKICGPDNWIAYPLLIFIFLPPGITALYSWAVEPVYQTKAFIASVFLLPVLWVLVLEKQRKVIQVSGVALLAVLVAFYFFPHQTARVDWKDLANRLDSDGQYFHVSLNSYLPLAWYLPDADHVVFDYPANLEVDLTPQTRRGLGITTTPDLPPGVTAITHNCPENDTGQILIMQEIARRGVFLERFVDQGTGIVDIYQIPQAVAHAR